MEIFSDILDVESCRICLNEMYYGSFFVREITAALMQDIVKEAHICARYAVILTKTRFIILNLHECGRVVENMYYNYYQDRRETG